MRATGILGQARSGQPFIARKASSIHTIKFNCVLLILFIASLFSAVSVVYMKDLNRRLFIQYQDLQQVCQQYEIEWGKLLLEQSTWSTQARIQQIAQRQLNMIYPKQKNIVIIDLD